jgi:hypothetical protein
MVTFKSAKYLRLWHYIKSYYPLNISKYIALVSTEIYQNMKKEYCCLQLEDAVLTGGIREEAFVADKPLFNIFIAEYVTKKSISKKWLFMKEERIDTKEIILKHCLFCGTVLT